MLLMLIACFISDEDVDRALDPDGDGFGPEDDCAPMDPAAFPGAVEVCGDGVVNDCEMTEEEAARELCRLQGMMPLADADLKLVAEVPGDYVGESVAGAGDVDGDGCADLLVGAPFRGIIGPQAGAAYLLTSSGALNGHGTRLGLGEAELKHYGEQEGDLAGWSVAMLGDVDGDWLADWAVGAHYHDGVAENTGAVYVHLSSRELSPPARTGPLGSVRWTGEGASDHFGVAIASAGDVDKDGGADLIIGAYAHDGGGAKSGAAYLLLSSGALMSEVSISDTVVADCILTGEATGDEAGLAVAGVEDTDGDGVSELLIGALKHDRGGADAGAVYLLRSSFAPTCGVMSLGDADLKLTGEAAQDFAGRSVADAGDVDNDGLSDLLIGAQGQDSRATDAGAAYLLLASGALKTSASTLSLSAADLRILGEEEGDNAGFYVASAGDVDGDDRVDLLVGALRHDAGGVENTGAAYLLYSSELPFGSEASRDLNLNDADLKLVGEALGDYAGVSLSGAGDVNGDGLGELLIGSHHSGADTAAGADGAAYLIYGVSF